MTDLNYIDRDGEVKIVGQDATGNTVNYVSADANGNLSVKDYSDGPVAPGTAATTSSLAGGQFNTIPSVLTNTQQIALQVNLNGALDVSMRNKYLNVVGNRTDVVKSGPGVLQAIMINNSTTGGVLTIYDDTAASGTKIATITLPTGGVNPVPTAISNLGIEFETGLTVVTTGSIANDFTMIYQ